MPFVLMLAVLACTAAAADRISIGLTRSGAAIDAYTVPSSAAIAKKAIVIGGSKTIRQELQKWESLPERRRKFDVLGLMVPESAPLSFPPKGTAFRDEPESHSIWRWIGTQAPDLVLVTGEDAGGLVEALSQNAVLGLGRIPARAGGLASVKGDLDPSEAHGEVSRRLDRKPRDVAEALAAVYGHEFSEVSYIPAVAMLARLHLGALADVEQLAAPFRESGIALGQKPVESAIGGHLIFGALAELTGDPRYVALVRKAADTVLAQSLHNEMSDSVFMTCPLLAKAGKLTGDKRYFEASVAHLKTMQKLCLRADGLYRHSPLADIAWGRGNGFPALGVALLLADLPPDHPAYEEIVRGFQNHMAALSQNQDENGMWRQVVDRLGAWPELSATAMIGSAMLRGIRAGWLDGRSYAPKVERAWQAVSLRTAQDGSLLGVSESTGKQKSLEDYLRRVAIDGRDARGGAMVMLFATEMAGLQ